MNSGLANGADIREWSCLAVGAGAGRRVHVEGVHTLEGLFPWGQAPASDAGKQMSTVTGVVSIDSLRPASQSRASREPVRAGSPGG